jgi:hypothetical protein
MTQYSSATKTTAHMQASAFKSAVKMALHASNDLSFFPRADGYIPYDTYEAAQMQARLSQLLGCTLET